MIITVTNTKGGVGKTTTAVNLAAGLAEKGRRTLLVDLDPQSHATRCFLKEPPERDVTDLIMDKPGMAGRPVLLSAPSSRGAWDYESLCDELVRLRVPAAG